MFKSFNKFFNKKTNYDKLKKVITPVPSKFIHALMDSINLGLIDKTQSLLSDVSSGELANIIEQLDATNRKKLIFFLGSSIEPEIILELDKDIRKEIISVVGEHTFLNVVSKLDTDDLIVVLEELDDDLRGQYLKLLPKKSQRELVKKGLKFPENTAGRIMSTNVVSISASWTIGKTLKFLRQKKDLLPDDIYEVYILDSKKKPIGTLNLNTIVRSSSNTIVKDLMNTQFKTIPIDTDQEEIALGFKQNNLIAAPVVDKSGKIVGQINHDDIIDIIEEEAEEDLLRLSGVQSGDTYSAVLQTIKSRFSWLFINLLTAIAASFVIGIFEASLKQVVALAILMPIVASMGGNAGTQTLTVAVRSLALREITRANALRVIGKEFAVGAINGLIFAAIIGTIASYWFNLPLLGLVIAAAMILNLIIACLSGILIPLILDKTGIDPAIASTVVLTTITDIFGFFTFLGLGSIYLL
ncbi:MAG: Magnesium transporter MgtE [Alphaproteobacteria bacterium MarineAlpha6_Bin6]|nr:magnesium transporter [Pelagibacteraceae bacterium]PPR29520.1 MAG: Magnesium transporter MgtE [Alphaproteobacteria bacterium MarineAlpha6_Bin6]PPR32694.1 MAG: Magnesium transporter MgtE [Alphaproteobacteria bacterium MarineAlpha6_Bin5]|tara:strand:+ start:19752 stop:21161 length:1410 start_codon:yes stop_codon:yes gene_type:complete